MAYHQNPQAVAAAHSFAQVPQRPHPRSKFDRSHGKILDMDAGQLYPVMVDEVLPGDTYACTPTLFARLATLLRPIMDVLYLDVHFFFVPNRLLWDNWQAFMGEKEPGDTTEYLEPVFEDNTTFAENTLGDYMGLPIGVALDNVRCLPFRALHLIWNDWYRDQNLQDSLPVNTGDGPDDIADYTLGALPRNKRHDYFTSSLPWPLKGGVDVPLPLGTTAPVQSTGVAPFWSYDNQTDQTLRAGSGSGDAQFSATPGSADDAVFGSVTGLEVDLSAADAAGINEMRQAVALQQLLEREARGGSRYVEIIQSAFGVRSSDARLMRPEFLGGGGSAIVTQQVPATNRASVPATKLGDLGAFGQGINHGRGFTKTFEEHGFVIGLASIRSDLKYQQGLDRMWSRSTKYDHFWPELAHLGEQAVLSKEIYADGTAGDEDVFGYQERYAEYRYKQSTTAGLLRSANSQSLDVNHLAQDFMARPTLSDAFIQENPPLARVVATSSDPTFLVDCWFRLVCARPLPVFAVPGLSRF